jgi:tetratricopeptide (TPR) repeat protein
MRFRPRTTLLLSIVSILLTTGYACAGGFDANGLKSHAQALYESGQFHYAVDELKTVLQANPKDSDALLLMAKSLQSMHRSDKAMTYYEQFVASLPQSDYRVQQYKTLIQALQGSPSGHIDAAARAKAGNYMAAMRGSNFARWKDAAHIKVFVVDGKSVEGYRPEFEEALRQAFDDWNDQTENKIGFEFVAKPEDAQITVTWTSDLHAPALKAEAGLATTSYDEDGLSHADVQLLTVDPFKDGPIGKNHLYNICLHEIGHALGLGGHSPHEEDIMSPMLYTQQGLSARDINTILALYSAEATTETQPDVDEWGRPLTPEARAKSLSHAGAVAAMGKKYDEAIEKLQEALKLNPNDEVAKKNLSVSANNLAVAPSTSREKAIELLKMAIKWDPRNEAAKSNLANLLSSEK